MQVIVRDPPVFSPRPQLQYHGQVGEEVTLVCGGQGSPTPEVTWKRVCNMKEFYNLYVYIIILHVSISQLVLFSITNYSYVAKLAAMIIFLKFYMWKHMSHIFWRNQTFCLQPSILPLGSGVWGPPSETFALERWLKRLKTTWYTDLFWCHFQRDNQNLPRDRTDIVGGNLTIRSLRKSDHAYYECMVSNEIATLVTATQLLVEGTTPHPPYNITSETDPFSVKLSWLPGYPGGKDWEQQYTIW